MKVRGSRFPPRPQTGRRGRSHTGRSDQDIRAPHFFDARSYHFCRLDLQLLARSLCASFRQKLGWRSAGESSYRQSFKGAKSFSRSDACSSSLLHFSHSTPLPTPSPPLSAKRDVRPALFQGTRAPRTCRAPRHVSSGLPVAARALRTRNSFERLLILMARAESV